MQMENFMLVSIHFQLVIKDIMCCSLQMILEGEPVRNDHTV